LSFRIAVIGDIDAATGFSLAGVLHAYVHTERGMTLARLSELLANEEIGLLLITHRVAEELGAEFGRMLRAKRMLPVVLKIPDKTGYMPKVDELYELIKRAVGAEVVVKAEGS